MQTTFMPMVRSTQTIMGCMQKWTWNQKTLSKMITLCTYTFSNVHVICIFLACMRARARACVCTVKCMAYELADVRAWVRVNTSACQVSICKTKASWWLPVLENPRTHAALVFQEGRSLLTRDSSLTSLVNVGHRDDVITLHNRAQVWDCDIIWTWQRYDKVWIRDPHRGS